MVQWHTIRAVSVGVHVQREHSQRQSLFVQVRSGWQVAVGRRCLTHGGCGRGQLEEAKKALSEAEEAKTKLWKNVEGLEKKACAPVLSASSSPRALSFVAFVQPHFLLTCENSTHTLHSSLPLKPPFLLHLTRPRYLGHAAEGEGVGAEEAPLGAGGGQGRGASGAGLHPFMLAALPFLESTLTFALAVLPCMAATLTCMVRGAGAGEAGAGAARRREAGARGEQG